MESRRHAIIETVINKDFKIEFHEGGGFTISSDKAISVGLMQQIIKQVTIRGLMASGQTYDTFPPTHVPTASSTLIKHAETTDPQPECCLLWCIPQCLRNCLKRLCCC